VPAPIKLLIVDDHPTLRHGLISVLTAFDEQFQVVAEAANGEEALLKFVASKPDVVVTDWLFAPSDPTDGIDLILELRDLDPQAKVVMITGQSDDECLLLANDIGANAFLSKHATASEIAKAIDVVASGFTHFPARLREVLGKRKATPQLTEREKQLIPLIALGLTAKEMAKELATRDPTDSISNRTIEIHKGNIKRKFGLTSPNALIAFSMNYAKKIRK
jgi:DNA-binding NarL/FixJ family response regulator